MKQFTVEYLLFCKDTDHSIEYIIKMIRFMGFRSENVLH